MVDKQNSVDVSIDSSKKSSKSKKILAVVLIILAVACGVGVYFLNHKSSTTLKNEPKKLESPYKMSGNSLEDFDLQFLKLENKEANKVYSPLSIKYALQMLSMGTNGTSKEQIDNVIGKYQSRKYTNSSNMSFANAMLIRNSYKEYIKDSYVSNLKTKYDAEVIYDAFSNAKPINDWVSNKTFKLVKNIIDDEDISKNDFFLVNALAINMDWKNRIQPDVAMGDSSYHGISYSHENYNASIEAINGEPSSKVKFNNSKDAAALDVLAVINNYDIVNKLGKDNIKKTVKKEYEAYLKENNEKATEKEIDEFLEKFIKELDSNYYSDPAYTTDFSIYTDDSVKAFAKDLKTYNGTTLEYVGIMPTKDNLTDFIKNSTAKSINEITSKLKTLRKENFEEGKIVEITGSIPVFNFEYNLNLLNDLKSLGINDVFTEGKADLSELTTSKGNPFIKTAIHKANIEFSNEGIKAGAASILGGGDGDALEGFEYLFDVPVQKINITFDKPYMFMIRDKATGEVWFTGTVYEPTEAHAKTE